MTWHRALLKKEVQHPDGTRQRWKYLPAMSYVSEYTDELGVRNSYQ